MTKLKTNRDSVLMLLKERECLAVKWKDSKDKIKSYESRLVEVFYVVHNGLKLIRTLNIEFNRSRKINGELLDKVDALNKRYNKEGELSTSDKKLLDKLRELENDFKKLGEEDKSIREEACRQTKQEKELKDRQLKLFKEMDAFYKKMNDEVKEFYKVRDEEKKALECFKILEGRG